MPLWFCSQRLIFFFFFQGEVGLRLTLSRELILNLSWALSGLTCSSCKSVSYTYLVCFPLSLVCLSLGNTFVVLSKANTIVDQLIKNLYYKMNNFIFLGKSQTLPCSSFSTVTISLLVLVLYHSKLNVFGFWTGGTKKTSNFRKSPWDLRKRDQHFVLFSDIL